MGCKSWCEFVIAVLVIVFALWATAYSKWVLVVLGAILLIHSCSSCKCLANNKQMSAKKK